MHPYGLSNDFLPSDLCCIEWKLNCYIINHSSPVHHCQTPFYITVHASASLKPIALFSLLEQRTHVFLSLFLKPKVSIGTLNRPKTHTCLYRHIIHVLCRQLSIFNLCKETFIHVNFFQHSY